jgi:hypothetical protein
MVVGYWSGLISVYVFPASSLAASQPSSCCKRQASSESAARHPAAVVMMFRAFELQRITIAELCGHLSSRAISLRLILSD